MMLADALCSEYMLSKNGKQKLPHPRFVLQNIRGEYAERAVTGRWCGRLRCFFGVSGCVCVVLDFCVFDFWGTVFGEFVVGLFDFLLRGEFYWWTEGRGWWGCWGY